MSGSAGQKILTPVLRVGVSSCGQHVGPQARGLLMLHAENACDTTKSTSEQHSTSPLFKCVLQLFMADPAAFGCRPARRPNCSLVVMFCKIIFVSWIPSSDASLPFLCGPSHISNTSG